MLKQSPLYFLAAHKIIVTSVSVKCARYFPNMFGTCRLSNFQAKLPCDRSFVATLVLRRDHATIRAKTQVAKISLSYKTRQVNKSFPFQIIRFQTLLYVYFSVCSTLFCAQTTQKFRWVFQSILKYAQLFTLTLHLICNFQYKNILKEQNNKVLADHLEC